MQDNAVAISTMIKKLAHPFVSSWLLGRKETANGGTARVCTCILLKQFTSFTYGQTVSSDYDNSVRCAFSSTLIHRTLPNRHHLKQRQQLTPTTNINTKQSREECCTRTRWIEPPFDELSTDDKKHKTFDFVFNFIQRLPGPNSVRAKSCEGPWNE